jgi:hypothetical protein
MLQDIGSGSFRFPLDFLLGLVLQWGLVLLFTTLYLHRFTEQLGRQGWAAVATIWVGMAILPFFTASTLAAWVPLWVIILLKGLKRYRWHTKDLILIGCYGLLLSLAWLQVNSPELIEWLAQPARSTNLQIQKWAVHLPEYRSFWAYLIGAVLLLGVTGLLYLRKGRYQRMMTT